MGILSKPFFLQCGIFPSSSVHLKNHFKALLVVVCCPIGMVLIFAPMYTLETSVAHCVSSWTGQIGYIASPSTRARPTKRRRRARFRFASVSLPPLQKLGHHRIYCKQNWFGAEKFPQKSLVGFCVFLLCGACAVRENIGHTRYWVLASLFVQFNKLVKVILRVSHIFCNFSSVSIVHLHHYIEVLV